jgi:hypothetical protein
MPIVATIKFDLLDMAVLLCLVAPSKHHSLEGREHGRTIPLAAASIPKIAAFRQWLPAEAETDARRLAPASG